MSTYQAVLQVSDPDLAALAQQALSELGMAVLREPGDPAVVGIADGDPATARAALGSELPLLLLGGAPETADDSTEVLAGVASVRRIRRLAAALCERSPRELRRLTQVAGLLHDVRLAWCQTLGYLDVLALAEPSLPRAQLADLSQARYAARRAAALLDGMLDLLRQTAGAPPRLERCDLAELAGETLAVAGGSGKLAQITLQLDAGRGDWAVLADRAALERILLNLVDNAIRHSPPQGQVSVTLSEADDDLELVVADQGRGLSGVGDDLFRPFQSGGRGAGIGLSIARDLARQAGGDLQASNRPGGGSAFTLRWPRLLTSPERRRAR
ncbi:MAG: sensor histidine kinase [Fimbriimonadaceae bacterium]|nr:sensor histidine kinase [Fimbriimonadaceae bacterium]